jgi:hypothetical protein
VARGLSGQGRIAVMCFMVMTSKRNSWRGRIIPCEKMFLDKWWTLALVCLSDLEQELKRRRLLVTLVYQHGLSRC